MSKLLSLPTINVCGNEVPLPAYWKVVDLRNEGRSNEAIVTLILCNMDRCNPKLIEDIVFDIIDNQIQMKTRPANVKQTSNVLKKPRKVSAYRASRIAAQAELSDAQVRLQAAQDEEEQAIMRTFEMIRKKGATSSDVRRMNDPEVQEALEWFQQAKHRTDTARELINIHKSSLR